MRQFSKRPLGRTDLTVTPLGLGGGWLGRTDKPIEESQAIETVLGALEHGINLIDTAPAYGESERRIGLALEQWGRSGGRRQDIVLSTKVGIAGNPRDFSGEHTRQSVQRSLELLRTDYLDIVHLHDPQDLTEALSPGGAVEALEQLKAEGTVRAIGIGSNRHEILREFIESGPADAILTFGDFNLLSQSAVNGVIEPAVARNVGVINAMVVAYGLLAGGEPRKLIDDPPARYLARHEQKAQDIWLWAQQRGISMLSLALQFSLREERIATTLVGVSSVEQIDADVAAVLDPLGESVWDELRQAHLLEYSC